MSASTADIKLEEAPASALDQMFCKITYRDWGRIFACFTVLYLFVTAYYASLLTVAVTLRGGEQYKSLPSRFYGGFDRDFYFQGMGARLNNDGDALYPWIKATQCSDNLKNWACTPACDVPTMNFQKEECLNKDCGVKCVNP